MPNRSPFPPLHPTRTEHGRACGSGMGADSAFEEMIRSRPVVHRPAPPQSPPVRCVMLQRRSGG